MNLASPSLGFDEFDAIRQFLYKACGIRLNDQKEELVRSRLLRRLRELNLSTFREYLARVEKDAQERTQLIDALTTNTTQFFRERHHFDLLTSTYLPRWHERRQPVRIWSAGCSSGQEPYTLGMTIRDFGRVNDIKILATDISTKVLAMASSGVYPDDEVAGLPPGIMSKHFEPGPSPGTHRVAAQTRAYVKFARLNLLERWPMKGPFQAIFCRNVMIYFERDLQLKLAERYIELLEPGGLLCIGHSESIPQGRFPIKVIAPATYEKIA